MLDDNESIVGVEQYFCESVAKNAQWCRLIRSLPFSSNGCNLLALSTSEVGNPSLASLTDKILRPSTSNNLPNDRTIVNKPTRILFPTGSFYPAQNGGPDNTVYWITKALKRRGYDTVISSTDWGQPETTKINEWIDTDFGKVVYAKDLIHYLPLVSLKYMLSQIKTQILYISR